MDRRLKVIGPERSRQLRQAAIDKMDPPRRHAEVIERMLRPKIAGQALDDEVAHLLHEADLYSDTPDELAAGRPPALRQNWFFLTRLRYRDGRTLARRHDNGGVWIPYTRLEVAGDSGPVGHRRSYCYMVNNVKTHWMMTEYSIPQDQQGEGEQLVICTMGALGRRRSVVRLNNSVGGKIV